MFEKLNFTCGQLGNFYLIFERTPDLNITKINFLNDPGNEIKKYIVEKKSKYYDCLFVRIRRIYLFNVPFYQ